MGDVVLKILNRYLMELNPSEGIGPVEQGLKWGIVDVPIADPTPYNPQDVTELEMIRVPLATLQNFDTTCRWLEHIAQFLFTVQGQINRLNDEQLIAVNAADQLQAAVYYFILVNTNARSVYLARWYSGAHTGVPEEPAPRLDQQTQTTFKTGVHLREGQACKVSHLTRRRYPCVSSHLIPKRLGPYGVQNIFRRYNNTNPDWQQDEQRPEWDHRVGVLIIKTFDSMVDDFKMGFYLHNGNTVCKSVND